MTEKEPLLPDDKPPNDESDVDSPQEDLIAYLDGELDPNQTEALENQLSQDPKLRQEAEIMKRTWDLLDFLPRPEPSANFTEKTVSRIDPIPALPTAATSSLSPAMVVPSTGSLTVVPALPTPFSRRSILSWLLISVVAGLAGWLLQPVIQKRLFPPDDPNKAMEYQILQDKRILENLIYYRHVDDMEFLKALDKPDQFADDPLGN